MLILFRALSAVGGAAVIPSSLALIADAFDPEERVKAFGWWSATIAVAPLLGVVAGGFVVESLGWRWLFFAQFPFGVAALVLGFVVLHESRGEAAAFDAAGTVLSIAGLGALILALNRGPVGGWDWLSMPMVVTALGAVALLVAFVRVEARIASPVLPIGFFRRRRFSAAVGANFCVNFAYMGGFFITSMMLAEPALFGYRADQVALAVAPRAASLGIMGPIGGYLAARHGGRRMASAGAALMVASMVLLALVDAGDPYLVVFPGLVLSGFGLGLVGPTAAATVTNEATSDDLGRVSAALNMGASIGSSLGIATMQAVLAGVAAHPANPGIDAFRASYLFGAGASVLGLVAAANLGPGDGRDPSTE
jgi:MFS family permease